MDLSPAIPTIVKSSLNIFITCYYNWTFSQFGVEALELNEEKYRKTILCIKYLKTTVLL